MTPRRSIINWDAESQIDEKMDVVNKPPSLEGIRGDCRQTVPLVSSMVCR